MRCVCTDRHCCVWPWLIDFSNIVLFPVFSLNWLTLAVLYCFMFSHSTSFTEVSPIKLEDSSIPLFKATLYSLFNSVHLSPVTWPTGLSRGHDSRDPLPVFCRGGCCEQFWHVQGCPLFHVVRPAFSLSTTASPTFQVLWRMVLGRLSWRVTHLYHAIFRLLTVAKRGSCGPTVMGQKNWLLGSVQADHLR